MGLIQKLFGTHSENELKRIYPIADAIEALDSEMQSLSDEELRNKTKEFKERLANGETLDDILPEAYAAVREAAYRTLGMKHYRVQLIFFHRIVCIVCTGSVVLIIQSGIVIVCSIIHSIIRIIIVIQTVFYIINTVLHVISYIFNNTAIVIVICGSFRRSIVIGRVIIICIIAAGCKPHHHSCTHQN